MTWLWVLGAVAYVTVAVLLARRMMGEMFVGPPFAILGLVIFAALWPLTLFITWIWTLVLGRRSQ